MNSSLIWLEEKSQGQLENSGFGRGSEIDAKNLIRCQPVI
jgi:hypothetical protein